MSDTPRTDKMWEQCCQELPFSLSSKNPFKSLGEIVPASFARRLERQNADLLQSLQRLRHVAELLCQHKPVRDVSEAFAEADSAIAKATGDINV